MQSREKQEAIEELRKMFPPGATVYTILDRVSRSGMSRDIRVLALSVGIEGGIIDLHPNYLVSKALGMPLDKRGDALRVSGCGMDMGFHLASRISSVLYGKEGGLKHRWL